MSIAAQVSRVEVRPRGSSLVADVAAGATQVTVADPTLFGAADRVQVGDDVRDYTSRTLSDAPPDVDGNPQQYATLTLSSGLSSALIMGTPVVLWSGDASTGQRLSDVALWVDQFTPEAQPVPVVVPSAQRDRWTRYEGIVDPPIPGTLSDDQQTFTADPGYQPLIDGTLIDPTTLPDTGSGEPTTAPTSSPTPDPYQYPGGVAVAWDAPLDPRTHVRLFLAPAIENSDGTGSIDTSLTPGAGNLYGNDVQPIATLSTLTLGGDPLDPRLHYQVALQAWNSVGDAPASAWVLCQPAFYAPVAVIDTLVSERIQSQGIAIASSQSGSYPQPFSGTSLPSGWTQTRTTGSGSATSTSLIATVENSGTPSGTDGSVLKFDPRTYGSGSEGFAYAAVYSDYTVGDFDLLARFQFSAATGFDVSSYFSIGSRSTNTSAGDGLNERGIWAQFTPGNPRFVVYSGVDGNTGKVKLLDYPVDPDGGGFVAGQWYWLRLTAMRGVVNARTWRDGQSEPTDFQTGASSSQITSGRTFARGVAYPINGSKPRPTFWVDSVTVTAYTTGFLVTPDGNGDWKQVLDPIRDRITATETKNSQQDGRLTTNESNIASNTSAITALGNRTTALEQPTHIGLRGDGSLQSIPNAQWTTLTVPTTAFSNGTWSPSSSVVTIPSSGIYSAEGAITWGDSTTGRRITRVETWTGTDPGVGNGIIVVNDERTPLRYFTTGAVTTGYVFAAGAKVRLIGYQTSGTALSTFTTGGTVPSLTLRKISSS